MAKEKTLSDNFITYSRKNKLFPKDIQEKFTSIESDLSESVTTALADDRAHNLGVMGNFKKDLVVEKDKKSVKLEYDPDDGYVRKISKKHIRYKAEQEKRKKQLIYGGIGAGAILLICLVILIIIGVKSGSGNDGKEISITKVEKKDTSIKMGDYRVEEVVIDGITYNRFTYSVKRGDMLHRIAGRFLKNTKAWPAIWENNKDWIIDPDLIYPGDQIVILIRK
jgi:hypothetical protein